MRGVKPNLSGEGGDGTITEAPEPPDWIGESAAEEWRRVVPDMIARRRLNEGDLGPLASYCLAMGEVRDMQKKISVEGAVTYDDKGRPRKHPAVGIRDAAMTQARLLANELGLTPVSRQRPGIRGGQQGGGGDLFAGMDY